MVTKRLESRDTREEGNSFLPRRPPRPKGGISVDVQCCEPIEGSTQIPDPQRHGSIIHITPSDPQSTHGYVSILSPNHEFGTMNDAEKAL